MSLPLQVFLLLRLRPLEGALPGVVVELDLGNLAMEVQVQEFEREVLEL